MAKLSKKKVWIIVAASIILIVLVVAAVQKGKNSKATKVAVETVELRTIIETVSANGKIQPAKDIKIPPYSKPAQTKQ